MHIFHTVLCTPPQVLTRRICLTLDQGLLQLVISSLILMTSMFDTGEILQGEIKCQSLFRVKGLNYSFKGKKTNKILATTHLQRLVFKAFFSFNGFIRIGFLRQSLPFQKYIIQYIIRQMHFLINHNQMDTIQYLQETFIVSVSASIPHRLFASHLQSRLHTASLLQAMRSIGHA